MESLLSYLNKSLTQQKLNDSQLYKQTGNNVTGNVVKWIDEGMWAGIPIGRKDEKMKTNELIKLIEDLGLEADFDYGQDDKDPGVLSAYYDGRKVLRAFTRWFGYWFVLESSFDKLDLYRRNRLLNAFIDYAYTPLDQREEK